MKKSSEKFDQVIKDKLDRLQVEYDPKSWDAFEQKLDAGDQPQVEDTLLDEVVFEKLRGLEPAGILPRWDLMSAKLDQEVATRRHLWGRRVMEVTLVLLILLTFVQYFGQQTPVRLIGNAGSTAASDVSEASSTAQEQTGTPTHSTDHNEASFNNPLATQQSISNAVVPPTSPATAQKMPIRINETPAIPGINSAAKTSEHISLTENASTPEIEISFEQNRMELLAAIETLDIAALEDVADDEHGLMLKPISQQRGFYISMFGSVDYNQIVTPPAMVEGQMLEGFDRYELGYGGGIMAGWETGRWEVGSGLIYTAKEYTPRPLLYIYDGSLKDGYSGEGFKLVELNMLQLPFNVRYNFVRYDKWRAYTTAGVSLHLTMQANYYIADETGFNRPAPSRPPSQHPGGPVNSPIDEKASILTGGILEGGSLLKNSYVTGNIGFGLERFMTERWSIFAQPTYHHSIRNKRKGIGPDQDRINTMSIFMGVRVKL